MRQKEWPLDVFKQYKTPIGGLKELVTPLRNTYDKNVEYLEKHRGVLFSMANFSSNLPYDPPNKDHPIDVLRDHSMRLEITPVDIYFNFLVQHRYIEEYDRYIPGDTVLSRRSLRIPIPSDNWQHRTRFFMPGQFRTSWTTGNC